MARFQRDYDRIDRILRDTAPQILDHLAQGHGCRFSALLRGQNRLVAATSRFAAWLLGGWRRSIWSFVLRLGAVANETARRGIVEEMDHRAGFIALFIGAPLLGRSGAQGQAELLSRG